MQLCSRRRRRCRYGWKTLSCTALMASCQFFIAIAIGCECACMRSFSLSALDAIALNIRWVSLSFACTQFDCLRRERKRGKHGKDHDHEPWNFVSIYPDVCALCEHSLTHTATSVQCKLHVSNNICVVFFSSSQRLLNDILYSIYPKLEKSTTS